jgi:hypothetical protein
LKFRYWNTEDRRNSNDLSPFLSSAGKAQINTIYLAFYSFQ